MSSTHIGTIETVAVESNNQPPPARRQYCIAYKRRLDDGHWMDAVTSTVYEWIHQETVQRWSADPRYAKLRTFEIEGEDK